MNGHLKIILRDGDFGFGDGNLRREVISETIPSRTTHRAVLRGNINGEGKVSIIWQLQDLRASSHFRPEAVERKSLVLSSRVAIFCVALGRPLMEAQVAYPLPLSPWLALAL